MYAKNFTHPWNVRGAMNCATTNGQFVKGYVILYKWYHTYTTQKLQTHNPGNSQKAFISLISLFENPIILQILVQTSAKNFTHPTKTDTFDNQSY